MNNKQFFMALALITVNGFLGFYFVKTPGEWWAPALIPITFIAGYYFKGKEDKE